MANKVVNRPSTSSPEQCSNIIPYIEDHLCEHVIGSSQLPVTSRDSQPDKSHNLYVTSLRKADNTKQLLHRENGTRPQPMLPPEPRPKCLPIPQPPPELHKPSTPATQPHDCTPHTTKDPHCEIVIVRNSQPPVRSRVQALHTQYFSELLTKQLNELGNSKLRQEDGTRPQKKPLLPPEPRPTHLPIPQPPPPPPSSPTVSHNTSDQSRDDRCLSLTISSGYGSLTRSMEGLYFMHCDEDNIYDDDFD